MGSAEREQLGADLSAYLDGELSPRRAQEVERLLSESDDARRLLAELRSVSEELRDLPRMRAPEVLADWMRRAITGQAGGRPGVPAGGVRVLRLVSRAVASAAVIVVCVIAGWMMHDRMGPPAAMDRSIAAAESPGAKREKGATLARGTPPKEVAGSEVAVAEAPAVAMAELESLGYVGADRAEDADVGRSAEALGDEALAAARVLSAEAGEAALALDMGKPLADMPPVVNVVVAPRDAGEFDAAVQVVAAWEPPAPTMKAGRMARGRGKGSGVGLGPEGARSGEAQPSEGAAGLAQREFVVQVPPERVREVLQSLEQRVPRQVQVALAFSPRALPEVQRMVVPVSPASSPVAEPEVAELGRSAAEPADPVAGRMASRRSRGMAPSAGDAFEGGAPVGRAGGRGRVVREPVPAERDAGMASATAEEPEGVAGGVEDGAPRAARRGVSGELDVAGEQEERVEWKEEPPTREKKDMPLAAKERTANLRCPPVAEVARPTSEMIREQLVTAGRTTGQVPRESEAEVEPQAAGALMHERARELRDHLGEMYETVFGGAFRASPAPGPEGAGEGPASVTLRVTVLSPPATTRPAADRSAAESP